MRHNYRKMLSYNPVEKRVINYIELGEEYLFASRRLDEEFYKLWGLSNHTTEAILGVSIGGDLYQLSPVEYGSYIKEDLYSAQTIHKGAVLTAIATYKKQHHIPFDD